MFTLVHMFIQFKVYLLNFTYLSPFNSKLFNKLLQVVSCSFPYCKYCKQNKRQGWWVQTSINTTEFFHKGSNQLSMVEIKQTLAVWRIVVSRSIHTAASMHWIVPQTYCWVIAPLRTFLKVVSPPPLSAEVMWKSPIVDNCQARCKSFNGQTRMLAQIHWNICMYQGRDYLLM